MIKNHRLDIGLPFHVTSVQAVLYFQSQGLVSAAIKYRLREEGLKMPSIHQAFFRARKQRNLLARRRA